MKKTICFLIATMLTAGISAQESIVSFFDEVDEVGNLFSNFETLPDSCYITYVFDTIHNTAQASCIGDYGKDEYSKDGMAIPATIVDPERGKECVVTRFCNSESYAWPRADYISLSLPHTIQEIDLWSISAFSKHLESISVAEDNPYYTTIAGVLYDKQVNTLLCCPPGKKGALTLPKTVKQIEKDAFMNCSALSAIYVEEGNRVYQSENGLLLKGNTLIAYPTEKNSGQCFIPAKVTSIAPRAIYANGITDFEVESGNKKYQALEGVLYSKDGKTLVAYPGACGRSSFAIPEGVTTIASDVFYEDQTLKGLIFPTSLKKIGDYVMYLCDNLRFIINYSAKIQKVGKSVADSYPPVYVYAPTKMAKKYSKWWSEVYPINNSGKIARIGEWNVSASDRTLSFTGPVRIEQPRYDEDERWMPYCRIVEHVKVSPETEVYVDAFEGFDNVQDFAVEEDTFHMHGSSNRSANGVLLTRNFGYELFRAPKLLNTYTIIAFPPARKIANYVIPDSVTGIGEDAFRYCHISTLTIHDSVSSIGLLSKGYFDQFIVSPPNKDYFSIDGVLFQRQEANFRDTKHTYTILCAYPRGKKDSCYMIPSGVEWVDEEAFAENQHIQEIHVPEGVGYIKRSAFYHCWNLRAIYLHSTEPPYLLDSRIRYMSYDAIFRSGITIYVPEQAVEAYKSHNDWSKYADQIKPIPDNQIEKDRQENR